MVYGSCGTAASGGYDENPLLMIEHVVAGIITKP